MMKTEKSQYVIQTVCHAIDLLEQFNGDEAELGVTELSQRLKLHKNNVFRLLATLESRNYIEQNRMTGNYRLGLRNMALGQNLIRQMGLKNQARPILESITSDINETTYVAVLKDSYIICLDAVESTLPVRVVSRLGAWLPAYCTAAGKVHLAFMNSMQQALHLPRELQRYTPSTITNRRILERHLRQVAENGYAIDDEELDTGVRCVSAPIRDSSNKIIGAISISGPAMRFSDERMVNELIPRVLDGVEQISATLGRR